MGKYQSSHEEKQRGFRTWKSGKSWLYAAGAFIVLAGVVGARTEISVRADSVTTAPTSAVTSSAASAAVTESSTTGSLSSSSTSEASMSSSQVLSVANSIVSGLSDYSSTVSNASTAASAIYSGAFVEASDDVSTASSMAQSDYVNAKNASKEAVAAQVQYKSDSNTANNFKNNKDSFQFSLQTLEQNSAAIISSAVSSAISSENSLVAANRKAESDYASEAIADQKNFNSLAQNYSSAIASSISLAQSYSSTANSLINSVATLPSSFTTSTANSFKSAFNDALNGLEAVESYAQLVSIIEAKDPTDAVDVDWVTTAFNGLGDLYASMYPSIDNVLENIGSDYAKGIDLIQQEEDEIDGIVPALTPQESGDSLAAKDLGISNHLFDSLNAQSLISSAMSYASAATGFLGGNPLNPTANGNSANFYFSSAAASMARSQIISEQNAANTEAANYATNSSNAIYLKSPAGQASLQNSAQNSINANIASLISSAAVQGDSYAYYASLASSDAALASSLTADSEIFTSLANSETSYANFMASYGVEDILLGQLVVPAYYGQLADADMNDGELGDYIPYAEDYFYSVSELANNLASGGNISSLKNELQSAYDGFTYTAYLNNSLISYAATSSQAFSVVKSSFASSASVAGSMEQAFNFSQAVTSNTDPTDIEGNPSFASLAFSMESQAMVELASGYTIEQFYNSLTPQTRFQTSDILNSDLVKLTDVEAFSSDIQTNVFNGGGNWIASKNWISATVSNASAAGISVNDAITNSLYNDISMAAGGVGYATGFGTIFEGASSYTKVANQAEINYLTQFVSDFPQIRSMAASDAHWAGMDVADGAYNPNGKPFVASDYVFMSISAGSTLASIAGSSASYSSELNSIETNVAFELASTAADVRTGGITSWNNSQLSEQTALSGALFYASLAGIPSQSLISYEQSLVRSDALSKASEAAQDFVGYAGGGDASKQFLDSSGAMRVLTKGSSAASLANVSSSYSAAVYSNAASEAYFLIQSEVAAGGNYGYFTYASATTFSDGSTVLGSMENISITANDISMAASFYGSIAGISSDELSSYEQSLRNSMTSSAGSSSADSSSAGSSNSSSTSPSSTGSSNSSSSNTSSSGSSNSSSSSASSVTSSSSSSSNTSNAGSSSASSENSGVSTNSNASNSTDNLLNEVSISTNNITINQNATFSMKDLVNSFTNAFPGNGDGGYNSGKPISLMTFMKMGGSEIDSATSWHSNDGGPISATTPIDSDAYPLYYIESRGAEGNAEGIWFEVDVSKVDTSKAGTYTVTYKAIDMDGYSDDSNGGMNYDTGWSNSYYATKILGTSTVTVVAPTSLTPPSESAGQTTTTNGTTVTTTGTGANAGIVLNAKNLIFPAGTAWTAVKSYISGTDKGKAIDFNQLKIISNDVNPNVPGIYHITFCYGDPVTITATVTVYSSSSSKTGNNSSTTGNNSTTTGQTAQTGQTALTTTSAKTMAYAPTKTSPVAMSMNTTKTLPTTGEKSDNSLLALGMGLLAMTTFTFLYSGFKRKNRNQ